jgi:hypothetical protein
MELSESTVSCLKKMKKKKGAADCGDISRRHRQRIIGPTARNLPDKLLYQPYAESLLTSGISHSIFELVTVRGNEFGARSQAEVGVESRSSFDWNLIIIEPKG